MTTWAGGAAVLVLAGLPSVSLAQDTLSRPVVYRLAGMDSVRVQEGIVYKHADGTDLTMNVGMPAAGPGSAAAPIIVFIHGGPLGRTVQRPPTDWGVYRSWVRLAPASGFVGVTFNFRYYDTTKEGLDRALSDVADAIDYVRKNAATYHADPTRICLWAFSGGGPMLTVGLDPFRSGIRCLVSYYAILTAGPALGDRYSVPRHPLAEGQVMPPVFIARAGLDSPAINRSVDAFVGRAEAEGFVFTVANHPTGQHGFDILDDDERSRAIIASTFDFVRECTAGAEPPAATRLARRVAAIHAAMRAGDNAALQRLADPAAWPGADAALLERVTSEDVTGRLYYTLMQEGERDRGVALVEWLVQRHPRSATAYDTLAGAYEAAGRPDDSRKATEKVLQLLDGPNDLSPDSRAALRKAAEDRLKRLSGK
jgi:acetyl esterase/lipase